MVLPSGNQWGGVLASGASYASDVVPANLDTAVKEDSETVATDAAGKDVYAGAYVGAGLSYQYTMGNALLDDNMSQVVAALSADDLILISSRVRTLGGTISAGYGILFDGNCYIGADLCVDITGDKHLSHNEGVYTGSHMKTAGVIPTIALRLGRYFSYIDCLAYARFGFTNLRNEFKNNQAFKANFRCQLASPIVGLGFEKLVLDKCSVRFECDYRFPANKTKSSFDGYDPNGNLIPSYRSKIENRARGYAVRLMCIYHF